MLLVVVSWSGSVDSACRTSGSIPREEAVTHDEDDENDESTALAPWCQEAGWERDYHTQAWPDLGRTWRSGIVMNQRDGPRLTVPPWFWSSMLYHTSLLNGMKQMKHMERNLRSPGVWGNLVIPNYEVMDSGFSVLALTMETLLLRLCSLINSPLDSLRLSMCVSARCYIGGSATSGGGLRQPGVIVLTTQGRAGGPPKR